MCCSFNGQKLEDLPSFLSLVDLLILIICLGSFVEILCVDLSSL